MVAAAGMKLIINADDFGLTPAVTRGIYDAMTRGVVTSTTMMVNAWAAEYAGTLVQENPELAVGLHINVSLGTPLTDCPSLIREGHFIKPAVLGSDDTYKEEDFFNIASFQHKISGSIKKNTTGGTGLTKLVSSLEKQSDAHKCYLITGNRALWFFHQYLEYNQDGWIGFNTENDFLNKTPAYTVIGPNSIYLPGTAYNLNFVMKRRTEKWIM